MLFNTVLKSWKCVYENEETTEQSTTDQSTTEKLNLKTLVEKHNLQEELNSMMAENRRKLTKQNQELVTQLQQIRENAQMSQQQRDELEARIEQLQEQFMSKEELAKREAQKFQKEHQKVVDSLTSEREKWQNLYSRETVQRSLQDAAISGEAFRPEQIVAMLGPATHLVEVLDATGHPTGAYQPVVKFNDINSDGEPVTLELKPADAIKRMKELPEHYGNLFKGSASGGIGSSSGTGGRETSTSLKEILKDPERFREWRKKNPDLDLSKLRK